MKYSVQPLKEIQKERKAGHCNRRVDVPSDFQWYNYYNISSIHLSHIQLSITKINLMKG